MDSFLFSDNCKVRTLGLLHTVARRNHRTIFDLSRLIDIPLFLCVKSILGLEQLSFCRKRLYLIHCLHHGFLANGWKCRLRYLGELGASKVGLRLTKPTKLLVVEKFCSFHGQGHMNRLIDRFLRGSSRLLSILIFRSTVLKLIEVKCGLEEFRLSDRS